jgi:hypothetical protein
MAGITLAEAEAQLAAYLAASTAIAEGGQSYQIANRQFTRADLAEIRASIDYWNGKVKELSQTSPGRRTIGVTPY